MKKFFTTIMLALAAVTAYSADEIPVTHEHPQRIIVNKEECNDDDWYEWQTWTTGTITFEEGFYGGMGYTHPIEVEKRVSRDSENKAWQMRILNYHRNQPREGNIDELIIQYDPVAKKIFIPTQDFGMRTAVEDKEGVKGIPAYITGYTTFYPDRTSEVESFDEKEGFMRIHTLVYWDGILLDDGTRGKYVYTESVDSFKLDGFTDYNVNILADECTDATSQEVQLNFTEDPHGVCYDIIHGLATEEKINAIADAKANPLSESQAVTFTLTEGLNSIVAISYDRQDKRYVNVKEIYCMPGDAGNWKALGTAIFTEDAISGLGSEMGVPRFNVAIEESISRPGYYRLVNPYVEYAPKYQGLSHHEGHAHYLYIDASVPSQVMLAQQHTGITDEKLGEIYITSKAYEDMQAGKMRIEYAKYLGTLEDGVISFPKEAIGIKLPDYHENYIWWTNSSACFGVRLPESGINSIESGDNAEKAYFTLQGIRTTNPVKGGIYIMVSGGKAEKIVY